MTFWHGEFLGTGRSERQRRSWTLSSATQAVHRPNLTAPDELIGLLEL